MQWLRNTQNLIKKNSFSWKTICNTPYQNHSKPALPFISSSASSCSVEVSQKHNLNALIISTVAAFTTTGEPCVKEASFYNTADLREEEKKRSCLIYKAFKTPFGSADTAVVNWRSCTATFEWSYFKESCSCQWYFGSTPVPSVWTHE